MRLFYLSVNESNLSGLCIARANTLDRFSPPVLKDEIALSNYDICRLKVNSANDGLLEQLDSLGVPFHIHSILVRNSIEITGEAFEIPDNIRFELYDGDNSEEIKSVIEGCLSNKTSTFYANKVFRHLVNEHIEMEMAKEYLSSFISKQNPTLLSWLIYADNEPAAFLAATVDEAGFEGVYYGVVPAFRGKYNLPAVIMRFIKNWCADNAVKTFSNDVPYQNLKSLVSIVRESVLPVSTYLHITLLPLLSYGGNETIQTINEMKADGLLSYSIDLYKHKLTSDYSLTNTTTSFFTGEKVYYDVELKSSVLDAGDVLMCICKFYTAGSLKAVVYLNYKKR